MQVRQAILDDTTGIVALFKAGVPRWQRINAAGQVEDLAYEQLTIYERWLHGGPWLTLETGAIWLNNSLRVGALAFVLEDADGSIIGYAEAYPGNEPPPLGAHLHLAHLVAAGDDAQAKDALMQHLLKAAAEIGRITACCSAYDEASIAFYKRYSLSALERVQQVNVPAQAGRGFYKATDYPHAPTSKIDGWAMPIGRTTSARHEFERMWPTLWASIPQVHGLSVQRQHFDAAGQEALILFRQQIYAPRTADVYCWTPKTLTSQLLIAIRDWSHRQGYRQLVMVVPQKLARMFDQDAETAPFQQDVYARDL